MTDLNDADFIAKLRAGTGALEECTLLMDEIAERMELLIKEEKEAKEDAKGYQEEVERMEGVHQEELAALAVDVRLLLQWTLHETGYCVNHLCEQLQTVMVKVLAKQVQAEVPSSPKDAF